MLPFVQFRLSVRKIALNAESAISGHPTLTNRALEFSWIRSGHFLLCVGVDGALDALRLLDLANLSSFA